MKNWFGLWVDEPFVLFGTTHFIMLALFLLGTFSLCMYVKLGRPHPRFNGWIRWSLFSMLVLSELSYQTWAVVNGVWSMADHIPLHLCGIASLIGMITLLTYQPRLIQLIYFIGILPAILALITPDVPFDYHHFRFWKFFIHHMAIAWTSLFLILSTTVRITWRSMIESFVYLLIYAGVVGFVNQQLGSNYLYLQHPPLSNTLLNYLGSGYLYVLNLILLAFFSFVLMWVIYRAITFHK